MRLHWSPSQGRRVLLALLAMLLLLLVIAVSGAQPPKISAEFEGASIEIAADKAWSILPGDCINISLQLEGIESLYIDGEGKIGWGELTFCPTFGAASPAFRITTQNGEIQVFTLDTHFLPTELLRCLLLVVILLLFFLAIHYFMNYRLDEPLPLSLSTAYAAGIGMLACLLGTAAGAFSITQVLQSVGDGFASLGWQLFGLLLAALVFIPLAIQSIKGGLQTGARADLVAIGGFLIFVLLLYLPFGFQSVGHWEEWVVNAWFEGRPSTVSTELVSRFWILVPTVLAHYSSPDSFAGYHLINFTMFWAKLVLLYGILKRLRVTPYLAFLITMLYMVYPVTDGLMSIRFFLMHFRIVTLLAAVYLALDARAATNRWILAGIWLSLLLHLGSYEAGYWLIAFAPLLWWIRPSSIARKLNLTAAWYLFPLAKLLYLVLLSTTDLQFYASRLVNDATELDPITFDTLRYYAGIIANVYRQTFWHGWREAVSLLAQGGFTVYVIVEGLLVGVVAAYLGRKFGAKPLPSRLHIVLGLLSGLLFIWLSIGILMWLEQYATDLRRMYIFVPIGAAVTVFCIVMLLSIFLKHSAVRTIFIGAACILLLIPATSRLFVQHAYHVAGANAKAKVLRQIIEQAPRLDKDTRLMLLTHMTRSDMLQRQVSPIRLNMFDSAIYLLYGEARPKVAFTCAIGRRCGADDIDIEADFLDSARDFSDVVIFRLHEDLSVELLRELPEELRDRQIENYDPLRLIDASAPLPPRAVTMLGMSRD